MSAPIRTLALLLAGAAMIGFIAAMAFTGRPPGSDVGHFESVGIIAAAPKTIVRIEFSRGKDRWAFRRRDAKAWTLDANGSAQVPDDLASHLDVGLQFLHVTTPTRSLEPADYRGASFADLQLDPPDALVSLASADGGSDTVAFGAANPSGTSQYVRVIGRPTLYLMPRYAGAEWRIVADMAKRLLPGAAAPTVADRSRGLLLPMSMEQVWAVEIVTAGALHRFERDNAGHWFLHLGQHSHAGGPAHVADPVKAPLIAAALDAFDQTRVEAVAARHPADIERYGLAHPGFIALLYARDNSTPVARIEVGSAADEGFARYVRLSKDGDVLKIAAYEVDRLVGLLKAVGAAS